MLCAKKMFPGVNDIIVLNERGNKGNNESRSEDGACKRNAMCRLLVDDGTICFRQQTLGAEFWKLHLTFIYFQI